jgi:hypothetical protein
MINTRINSESARNAVDLHRDAYNAAFYELGLKWHWDADIYQSILPRTQENDRLRNYLETHHPHLLKAYDAGFLVNAIQETKARCYDAMAAAHGSNDSHINWAEIQKAEIGV